MWSHVFSSPDDWRTWQVIRVQSGRQTEWWAVGSGSARYECSLRVFTVDTRRAEGGLMWHDVTLPRTVGRICGKLAYDGHSSIFIPDPILDIVHVLSTVTKQYDTLLLPRSGSRLSTFSVAVERGRDSVNTTIYVLYDRDPRVCVFSLIYE